MPIVLFYKTGMRREADDAGAEQHVVRCKWQAEIAVKEITSYQTMSHFNTIWRVVKRFSEFNS